MLNGFSWKEGRFYFLTLSVICILPFHSAILHAQQLQPEQPVVDLPADPHEKGPIGPWIPRTWAKPKPGEVATGSSTVIRGRFTSVQVNVDALGINIPGDAANEPSIAVDPTNPNHIVIVWRQFDTIASNFRQAGNAYSHDGGLTWTFPGVLTPGTFRSDPVIDVDAEGTFYYYTLKSNFNSDIFKSSDGGVTWSNPIPAPGGDKEWFVIDRTGGIGNGHLYHTATSGRGVSRSTDGGLTFQVNLDAPSNIAQWGTLAVSGNGNLFAVSAGFTVSRSLDAQVATSLVTWRTMGFGLLDGGLGIRRGPNPDGLLGQAWIATDHAAGPCRGRVYVAGSVNPAFSNDTLDIHFARSFNGGHTWSPWVRVNDDSPTNNAFQWFGTMSVAPNGRIDVIWNDTRNSGLANFSELHYSFSYDAGETWSTNIAASPMWDSWIGWPDQAKIGDYYDMVSDNQNAMLAFAATFNGEQDVYFLRLTPDCDGDGISDPAEIAAGTMNDCTGNGIPDSCEADCNGNGLPDTCEILKGDLTDANLNEIPDECEPDFDRDSIPDGCDLDTDNDGIPDVDDVCIFTPADALIRSDGSARADTNSDCRIDLADYTRWRQCISNSGPGVDPGLCANEIDLDMDRDVDLNDFAAFQRHFTGSAP